LLCAGVDHNGEVTSRFNGARPPCLPELLCWILVSALPRLGAGVDELLGCHAPGPGGGQELGNGGGQGESRGGEAVA